MPTMFEKIWDRHVVAEGPGGQTLLYIDRLLLHDGSTPALTRLRRSGRSVRRPQGLVATTDHYVPTGPASEAQANPEIRGMVEGLIRSTREEGVTLFEPGDARMGIVHVIGPEQGLTQPGITLVCGDSHTATHGALGALAFGIGSSEVEHVLATQCLWQRKPKVMRISVTGARGPGILVTAENFGCGSSRESAVWALMGAGFRCVIGPSFGDIFVENCFKNGVLAVVLPAEVAAELRRQLHAWPGTTIAVDLANQTLTAPDSSRHRFEVDPFRKQALLRGQDEIALTLEYAGEIEAFEARRAVEMPCSPRGVKNRRPPVHRPLRDDRVKAALAAS